MSTVATDVASDVATDSESDTRIVAGAVPAARALSLIDVAGRPTALHLTDLPGRDLDQEELLGLSATIAADPDTWSEHVRFSDTERHFVSLYRDAHVDVWLICWTPENDTGWHDHDVSGGAVAVTTGRLTEHNLSLGGGAVDTVVDAGRVFSFGPDHIHRLTGLDAGSVSVHAYSPPLWRMGQYSVAADGMLRRKSVSYADELRPLL